MRYGSKPQLGGQRARVYARMRGPRLSMRGQPMWGQSHWSQRMASHRSRAMVNASEDSFTACGVNA
eukprot:5585613-Pyramimonas_sp.AAC.1